MRRYRLYNFLDVYLDSNGRNGYDKYFDNEYARINGRTKASKTPGNRVRVTVRVVSRLPDSRPSDLERRVKFKGLFEYTYLIRGVATERVEIIFRDHPVSRLYVTAVGVYLQTQVLEPIMYLKLLEKGVLFLHAAGVAKNGQGYLLPAHGGTGKTTFSMSLLRHGFKLLGDDLLLVDTAKRRVYPYPRPLHLFTYNINSLRGARVPPKYKFIIYFKNGLRFFLEKILRTDFLIATRVHADQIFSGELFATPVHYRNIMFLRKGGPPVARQAITKTNLELIAKEIIDSADLNKSLYKLLGVDTSPIRAAEMRTVKRLLAQFGHITYLNTRKLNLDSTKSIRKVFGPAA